MDIDNYSTPTVEKVTLPSTLKSIGNGAFWDQTKLDMEIPEGVNRVGNRAFSDTGLTSFSMSNGTISENAFSGCSKLSLVELGENVTIGNYAFEKCGTAAEMTVNITGSGGNIGDSAFRECGSTDTPATLNFAGGCSYGSGIISGANIKTLTLPTDFAAGVTKDVYQRCLFSNQ